MVGYEMQPKGAITSRFDAKRKRLLKRYGKLRDERQANYDPMWRDISDYIAPGYGRFVCEDLNEGGRKNLAILDNSPERALTTLAAMVMAFSTSPARSWFSLSTVDPEIAKFKPAKLWLTDTTRRVQRVFSRSNTYAALHQNYEELAAFGNSCSIVVPNFDTVIHLHPVTIGQYVWATDFNGDVNTMFREFKLTVGQTVAEFGYEKCSSSVRNRFDNHDLDSQVTIVHVIEPRRERDDRYRDNKNMPFRSCYFELGSGKRSTEFSEGDQADDYLSESGFEAFPVLAGRWRVIGGDTYAMGPGLSALGDAKSLQHLQARFGLCVDLQTDPPWQVPMELANRHVDGLPGGRTPVPNGPGIRSLFESRLELQYLLESIRDTRNRIDKTFFVDMLLMLSSGSDYPQKTAREIVERHEEKMMLLGPVQQRMEVEIQKPLIQLTLGYMIDAGLLLPPPPELLESEMNIEFLSVFSQAQRAVGLHSTDRWLNTIGALSALRPDVVDKLNADRVAERYGDDLGVDPEFINSDDEVAAVRQQRAQQQAQQQRAESLAAEAGAVKDLATAPTGERSALTDILGNLQGYVSPSPGVQ